MQRRQRLFLAWSLIACGVLGLVVGGAIVVPSITHAGTATYTTTDPTIDNPSGTLTLCDNNAGSTQPVNCNIYTSKSYVWLSGGPLTANLNPGTYFFVVLDPGGQNNDLVDGTAKNLSCPHNTCSGYTTYQDRSFTINSNGTITYNGSHTLDTHDTSNPYIRVAPYADSTNGEYDLAICPVAGYPKLSKSDCKYDNFRIAATGNNPTVSKTASGSFTTPYTWAITKTVDSTSYTGDAGTTHDFHYTVTWTRTAGTGSGAVTGTITVANTNTYKSKGNTGVDPITLSGVTDALSGGVTETCVVYDSNNQIVAGGYVLSSASTAFTYSCPLSSLPSSQVDNKATLSWDTQVLQSGNVLGAGSADYTYSNVVITAKTHDASATVSDPLGNLSKTVSGSGSTTYTHTATVPASGCTTIPNTATLTPSDSMISQTASQTVEVCATGSAIPLTATKDASGTYTNTYTWGIQKAVDQTKQTVDPNTDALFTYTVTVTHDSGTASGIKVSGTIDVDNSNADAVTIDSVTDKLSDGTTCTVTNGGSQALASGTTHFAYTCSLSALPTSALTNAATITWGSQTVGGKSLSAGTAQATTGTITFTPTNVDDCVGVSDTLGGTLGTLCASDPSPSSFTYTHDVTAPATGCATQANTAQFVTNTTETSGTASQSVEACASSSTPTPTATPTNTPTTTTGRSGNGSANTPNTAQAPKVKAGTANQAPAQGTNGSHTVATTTVQPSSGFPVWLAVLLAVLSFAMIGTGATMFVRIRRAGTR